MPNSRRRLFTRGELRRQGVQVVARGSQTELVRNGRRYRFDRSQTPQESSTPAPTPTEPIESCSEQPVEHDEIAPLETPPKRRRSLSRLSEKAKRLRTPDPKRPDGSPTKPPRKHTHLTPLGKQRK
ncbi:hypothetical protein DL89DRAFT_295032 [Linderina pennispora]|uniref:Uncharacterized protein n=1 Tax=Linderina pennispora TaxID=61395 RepID=A0A1Y1W156_9FUNG|nr:uncharacterized protein DL89DRAFT_295032 [Linderina pennispora]ORX67269.1 hypothetical protein DL89DRAFT_295032 [Linderina pennispora]